MGRGLPNEEGISRVFLDPHFLIGTPSHVAGVNPLWEAHKKERINRKDSAKREKDLTFLFPGILVSSHKKIGFIFKN